MGGKRVTGIMVLGAALAGGLLPNTPGHAVTASIDQVVLVEPDGKWHIRIPGHVDYTFTYGQTGDIPLLGDWDGDGVDTPGVYRASQGAAHLTNQIPSFGSNLAADSTFFFGMAGDRVFAGDWNGDGIDTLGLSRDGQVFLANRNATTVASRIFWFGTRSDVPHGGDPDGDGVDGLFVHRPSQALVFHTNDPPDSFVAATTGSLYFGDPDDVLVTGDWNGDGVDSTGVFRPSDTTIHFRNGLWTGNAQGSYPFGRPDWRPVAGNLHLHVGSTPAVGPLTGLIGGDNARRVVIAKISNSHKARPQAGINDADMVMEAIVEGGVGRWIVLFQTQYPDVVGPVRSVREVDPKLIEPFDARVLHSGGVAAVRQALAEVAVDEGHGRIPGYYREGGRIRVYDLMYDFARLPEDEWVGTVEPVMRFDASIPAGGNPATTIDVAMSSPNTFSWEFENGDYFRHQNGSPSVDAEGTPITANTVVVVFVRPIVTGRFDSAGQAVPDYIVTGTGEAVVFRNGRAWTGTWQRDSNSEGFRLLRPDGRELLMDPGRTWIHVTPMTGSLDWE